MVTAVVVLELLYPCWETQPILAGVWRAKRLNEVKTNRLCRLFDSDGAAASW